MTLFFKGEIHDINNINDINNELPLLNGWQARIINDTLEIYKMSYSDDKAASELAAFREASIRAADAEVLKGSKAESLDEKESLDAMVAHHNAKIDRIVAGDIHYNIYCDTKTYAVPEGILCIIDGFPIMWTRGNARPLEVQKSRAVSTGVTSTIKPPRKLDYREPHIYTVQDARLCAYDLGGRSETLYDFGPSFGLIREIRDAVMIGTCVYVLTRDYMIVEFESSATRVLVDDQDMLRKYSATLNTDGKSLFVDFARDSSLYVWRPDLGRLEIVVSNVPDHSFMSIGEAKAIISKGGNIYICHDVHWSRLPVPEIEQQSTVYVDVTNSMIRTIGRLRNGDYEILRSSDGGISWNNTLLQHRGINVDSCVKRIGESHVLVDNVCIDLTTCEAKDARSKWLYSHNVVCTRASSMV